MKILFITSRFYPSVGGVEKHCFEIAKRLIDKGHKVTIITEFDQNQTYPTNSGEKSYVCQFEYEKIKVLAFKFGEKSWIKKFRMWFYLIKNIELLSSADIIHCHDVFVWYLPFRFLFFQKKVFTTFHGYESYPVKKSAIVIRKISEILSTGSICVGDFMKKWYFAKPDYVIYGAVNILKNKISPKPNSAIFFGRLDAQTGILKYIDAVNLIKKKIPTFKFEIVGDGVYKKKIKLPIKSVDSNVDKRITEFKFVFVSRYLSILEAFAAKRMVFALYDNKIKKDYLEMAPFASFISISATPKQLANEVLFYLKNPDKEIVNIEKGYEWARMQTWENVVSIYEKLWKKD